MTTPEQRLRMAAAILDFEARRDPQTKKLVVYKLPKVDGGGKFEVAGINERYHPVMAQALADLINAGQHEEAERKATEYLASYTDGVRTWTTVPGVEFFLRDCAFNRGPTGAARILQRALEVDDDGDVGEVTRAAVAAQEQLPRQLLAKLRAAREEYERVVVKRNEESIFWEGLVNRWNNALKIALGFLDSMASPVTGAPSPAPMATTLPAAIATAPTFGGTALPAAIATAARLATGATPTGALGPAAAAEPFDAAKALVSAATIASGGSPIGVLAPVLAPLLSSAVSRIVEGISSAVRPEPQLSAPQNPVAMRAMRLGSQGDLVKAWQTFLTGQQLDPGGNDGEFGDKTMAATKAFQAKHGLEADGVVGRQTLLKAMELGFELIEEPAPDMTGSNFPPRPSFPPLTGTAGRQAVFGRFDYVASPRPDNPEAIRILGNWEAENIVSVPIPQLRRALGNGAPISMRFHKLAAEQLKGLWADWEAANLLDRVLTYDGAFVPRFIRGSRTTLSNHAFGTAFDINAEWNGLGVRPKLVGQKGSVRELVPLAHKWGFYWGGHFGSRADGMHFEVAVAMGGSA